MTTTPTAQRPRYYRVADLRELLGASKNTVYSITRAEDFPAAIQLTDRGDLRWLADEVEAWLARRPRASRAAPRRVQVDRDQAELEFVPVSTGTRRRRSA